MPCRCRIDVSRASGPWTTYTVFAPTLASFQQAQAMIDTVLSGQDGEASEAAPQDPAPRRLNSDRPKRRRADDLNLTVGEVRAGVVAKCVEFGVFVDLEDAEGAVGTLLHQSRIPKGTLLHEGSKVTLRYVGLRQGRPEFDLVKNEAEVLPESEQID